MFKFKSLEFKKAFEKSQEKSKIIQQQMDALFLKNGLSPGGLINQLPEPDKTEWFLLKMGADKIVHDIYVDAEIWFIKRILSR